MSGDCHITDEECREIMLEHGMGETFADDGELYDPEHSKQAGHNEPIHLTGLRARYDLQFHPSLSMGKENKLASIAESSSVTSDEAGF